MPPINKLLTSSERQNARRKIVAWVTFLALLSMCSVINAREPEQKTALEQKDSRSHLVEGLLALIEGSNRRVGETLGKTLDAKRVLDAQIDILREIWGIPISSQNRSKDAANENKASLSPVLPSHRSKLINSESLIEGITYHEFIRRVYEFVKSQKDGDVIKAYYGGKQFPNDREQATNSDGSNRDDLYDGYGWTKLRAMFADCPNQDWPQLIDEFYPYIECARERAFTEKTPEACRDFLVAIYAFNGPDGSLFEGVKFRRIPDVLNIIRATFKPYQAISLLDEIYIFEMESRYGNG